MTIPLIESARSVLPAYMEFMTGMTEFFATTVEGSQGDEAFAALLLLFISTVMEDSNKEGIDRVTEQFNEIALPDSVEVRRRMNKLLDDMGLIDDTHMFN